MSDVMPSLVTKTLSSSSLPVKSSATTYRLGDTPLATSSMYWSTPPGGTPQAAQAEEELDQEGDREEVREAEEGWGGGVNGKQPDHTRQSSVHRQREERKKKKRTGLVCVVPRMRLLIPSRLTNTLSRSSLPVKSSAITYKLGLTALAASSMAWTRQHSSV